MTTDRALADRLRIRVNPAFDHDIAPDENEYGFWNPVSATNDLIKLANAALEITQAISDAMREKTQVELKLRKVTRELEALENAMLVADPLSPTEAKTLKTVAAALDRRFVAGGAFERAGELRDRRDSLQDDIDRIRSKIEAGHVWNKTNERVSENIRTALSFYKDEKRRAYQF
jgi:hypothetical protein